MIFLAAALIVAGVAGRARGGTLEALASVRFRWWPLLLAGLGLQLIVDLLAGDHSRGTWTLASLVVANVAVVVFLIVNRRLPGMWVALAGSMLNLLVIVLNGAMPISQRAADIAGIEESLDTATLEHEPVTDDTLLPWLGDVIPLPRTLEVLSIGDVVLGLGLAWLVYAGMRLRVEDADDAEGS